MKKEFYEERGEWHKPKMKKENEEITQEEIEEYNERCRKIPR